MHNRERIYEAGMRAAEPLARLLAGLHPRGRDAVDGRARAQRAFDEWGRLSRDASRPLVLLHAPSVGEALMAQAICAQLRTQIPDVQIAFSYFSPSAERMAGRVGADVAGYLPFDTRPAMRQLVRSLRPSAVAFVRTEIWPVLGLEAAAAGARTVFVNAALGERSSRVRSAARFILGPAYRRLDAIGAVDHESAQRFSAFHVDSSRVFVTGDARFDQVWARIESIDRTSPLLLRLGTIRPIVVAGSTWPADEAVLLDAFMRLPTHGRPRLIIAPHVPDDAHLTALAVALDERGITHTRLAALDDGHGGNAQVVVVDRVGVLADIYAVADVAYIGGGFGRDGLHSVVEAAALGVPSLFGPAHGNAREAALLARDGGGFVVRNDGEMAERLATLLADVAARERAGLAARAFVQAGLGAAQRNASLIAGLIAA